MSKIFSTPDWNDEDLAICKIYDDLVKEGKMTYRVIKESTCKLV
jgi:hypothetical protein